MAPSRVNKRRSDSSKQQHPIQYWDGKTYACMACKRGHRVKMCDHGKDGKPVSATNQPGRPSSGSDRKCTCPKSCKCTTNCKCAKEGCACTQQMFLLVALKSTSKPEACTQDPEPIPQWTDENGEEKTLKPVVTDLKGNVLSEEQLQVREQMKKRRRDGTATPPESGCCSSKLVKEDTSPTPAHGCRHRETIPQTPASQTISPSLTRSAANRCTCGVKCQCTLCPEHPNNTATRQYNAQQLNAMANNPAGSYMPTVSMVSGQLFKPEIPQQSCLGGEASYFLTREQPTLHDFQRLFPDYAPGDFVFTYPMDAPTYSYNQMNCTDPAEQLTFPNIGLNEMPIPTHSIPEFEQLNTDEFDDMAFMNQPLNFSFGDADVTTFGSRPLQSPNIIHSPIHQRTGSGSPGAKKSCCDVPPPHVAAPHTINPNILQAPTQNPTEARLTPQSATSLSNPINQDIFFDNTLASLPEHSQLDMSAFHPDFRDDQGFNHPYIHPLANS